MEAIETSPLVDWGVAALPLGGQNISGDQHLVKPFDNGILIGVVDGLGHGKEAAAAAQAAIAILAACPHCPIIELVRRCDRALRKTRGTVMSLASFDGTKETMTWIGIGNLTGVLVRADPAANTAHESLLLRGGVVGYKLPKLLAADVHVLPGDTLIFATDGLDREFARDLQPGIPPQRLATHLLTRYGKNIDDALVLVARWIGNRKTVQGG